MIVNAANLQTLFKGFSTSFNKGFDGAESHYKDVAMVVPSASRETTYGWLGQFPKMREWIGDRVLNNLTVSGYTVVNRLFEDTIAVARIDIEDDQFGVFGPIIEELGKSSAELPDDLIFSLLARGFSTPCYDKQYFFDTDHPVLNEFNVVTNVANTDGGTGNPWFLLDTSRAMKPMLWQDRIPAKLTSLDRDEDENVFLKDQYLYGVRARANAGYGLWQLAWGSKQPLDAAHYETARVAMRSFRGDEGRPLGIRPTTLVVGPANEGAAQRLLVNDLDAFGASNSWKGTAKLIVTPWLT